MQNRAVDLWTMRLRRNGSLAVENPGGFPTARAFAHKLHITGACSVEGWSKRP
jgi:hypothetical protein